MWETGHYQNHVVSNFQLWKAPLVAVFKIHLLNMDNFLWLLKNSVIRENILRVSWIAMNYQCNLVAEKCQKILLVSLHSIFGCHLLYGDQSNLNFVHFAVYFMIMASFMYLFTLFRSWKPHLWGRSSVSRWIACYNNYNNFLY